MIKYEHFIEKNILFKSDYCIATFIDRVNIYLELWLKNYIDLDLDFYIFVDKKCKKDVINFFKEKNKEKIIFVEIFCGEKYFMVNNSMGIFQQEIQKKFLKNYKKMIYVDIDELLICENFMDILKNNKKDYIVTNGFDIVHNYKIEKDYDKSKNLLEQRKYGSFVEQGKNNSYYDKVSIVSKEHIWKSIGKHAHGLPTDNLIYLIHLGRFDIKTMLENYKISKLLYKRIPVHQMFETEDSVKEYLDKTFMENIIEIPNIISKNIKF
jgi:hypothetical protein